MDKLSKCLLVVINEYEIMKLLILWRDGQLLLISETATVWNSYWNSMTIIGLVFSDIFSISSTKIAWDLSVKMPIPIVIDKKTEQKNVVAFANFVEKKYKIGSSRLLVSIPI